MAFVLFYNVGCVHFGTQKGTESASPKNEVGDGSEESLSSFRLSQAQGIDESEPEFESIPSDENPLVEKWLTYFQGRGRDHMERYLARSTRYEKLMKKVLKDNGLPPDLFYIALIESGFSSSATSHAAAVGYWQFIRGTGKRYGLEINKFVDERRDPVLATQAAAEYFKGLYSVFGSWYLAMASYNAGENRIKKLVMKHYTRDFWELSKQRGFPRETKNYTPKYLAARMIAKSPEKYGFEGIDYLSPIEFDQITVQNPTNLRVMAEKMNVNYEDFKALNPKFKGEVAPLKGQSLVLRVPPEMKDQALIAAQESVASEVQFVADVDTQSYRVRSGDSLYLIARKYRTTVAYLRDINEFPRGKKLRAGMRLQVPDRTPSSIRTSQAKSTVAPTKESRSEVSMNTQSLNNKYYIVQRGDSLFEIAKKYSLPISELKKENNIKNGRLLRVGTKIRIPEVTVKDAKDENRGSLHKIRRGESLFSIAEKYNTSVSAIRKVNGIKKSKKLIVGKTLKITLSVN